MLEINNLNVHFGVIHALNGISLKFEEGEIVLLSVQRRRKPKLCVRYPDLKTDQRYNFLTETI